jgi:DnaJ-domain-containing protein 1
MASSLYGDDEEETQSRRNCDFPGCPEEGQYPAPKSRTRLNERYYFCLDHVREYNKKWNYFDGFSEDEMYKQMQKDIVGDRPTWPSSISVKLEARLHDFIRKFTKENRASPHKKAPTSLSKEAQALQVLGLPPQTDTKTIKTRYRELVKKYHPDKNPDNPKAAERFKIIAEAYMILRAAWHTKDKDD